MDNQENLEETKEFKIIEIDNGITDVKYECREKDHFTTLTWCEENCTNYSYCQRVADAIDALVAWENDAV